MPKKFPARPANPERICWGCDKYCPSDSLSCGNGSDRTQHPFELFGEDWQAWGSDFVAEPTEAEPTDPSEPAPRAVSPDKP